MEHGGEIIRELFLHDGGVVLVSLMMELVD